MFSQQPNDLICLFLSQFEVLEPILKQCQNNRNLHMGHEEQIKNLYTIWYITWIYKLIYLCTFTTQK